MCAVEWFAHNEGDLAAGHTWLELVDHFLRYDVALLYGNLYNRGILNLGMLKLGMLQAQTETQRYRDN